LFHKNNGFAMWCTGFYHLGPGTMNIPITTNQDIFDNRPIFYVEKEDGLRIFNSYFNNSRLNNMLKWQMHSQKRNLKQI
jgi:hypothetical protein